MELHDRQRPYRVHAGFTIGPGSAMVPGLILIGVGALFFLSNLHIFYLREWVRFWPAILIAGGIVKLVDSTVAGGRVFGGVLVGFGGIFLARNLGYIDLGMREIWPLFLVGLGLLLLFQRTAEWHVKVPNPSEARVSDVNTLNVSAIFGGAKRVLTTQDFQGGHVLALFGGVELDLRQAAIVGDRAVLEIDAMFGGVELKIPQSWNAVVEGTGIFGGYADNTLQTNPALVPGVKQLIVKGAAVFGGVDVKN